MVKQNVPDRGDIVSLEFRPQRGREQAGRRPAIVLSPKAYNQRTGLAILCPITTQMKGYPFEVALPNTLKTKGVILVDHIKSLDFNARRARILERVPSPTIQATVSKLLVLLV